MYSLLKTFFAILFVSNLWDSFLHIKPNILVIKFATPVDGSLSKGYGGSFIYNQMYLFKESTCSCHHQPSQDLKHCHTPQSPPVSLRSVPPLSWPQETSQWSAFFQHRCVPFLEFRRNGIRKYGYVLFVWLRFICVSHLSVVCSFLLLMGSIVWMWSVYLVTWWTFWLFSGWGCYK